MKARTSGERNEIRATVRGVFLAPWTDRRWDGFQTREGPTRRRSANRACQLASPWSRNDHEDGGPTIQLPAADARCTLRSLSCDQVYAVRSAYWRVSTHESLAQSPCSAGAFDVQNLRIEEAKRLLESSDQPVDEICFAVGYEDASFFRRLFRRRTGVAPARYRRAFRPIHRGMPAVPQASKAESRPKAVREAGG